MCCLRLPKLLGTKEAVSRLLGPFVFIASLWMVGGHWEKRELASSDGLSVLPRKTMGGMMYYRLAFVGSPSLYTAEC